jgi:hypothetical protein
LNTRLAQPLRDFAFKGDSGVIMMHTDQTKIDAQSGLTQAIYDLALLGDLFSGVNPAHLELSEAGLCGLTLMLRSAQRATEAGCDTLCDATQHRSAA